ncbi:Copper amine oxidase N-terminal domain-containing protein [Paenibacillus sp. yr247]|uniref:copper amine oxidase N-terminal domain-containing protein n=1 Tax=Paenibacillus sp. yr247 TaxID=1761880 RepID=UPI0008811B2B|nr:copper amine oxidase N-terminal domain-containing protein [Paenibacillus sp. yr247]SDO22120.1 Copper amine oxidase N-terminal domain-containing protein [Paenibacillus sp. yr247]
MKKIGIALAACLVAASLLSASALAKRPDSVGDGGKEGKMSASSQVRGDDHDKQSDDESATVTSDTYQTHGHNGYKGLLNAIEHVKDKPAGAVIANLLLTKYAAHLTADQQAELSKIQAEDIALSALADLLDQKDNVTDAVYAEQAAVKANIKNIDSYKKLSKLYEKTGKTGVKLYVNGDEPVTEVAPFIREGSTLVPFRAISEALKATVTWNGEDRSVTVTSGTTTIKLLIDSKTAYVNGNPVTLDVPATIKDSSTVVPVRFVSEALKATVKWEPDTTSVVIYQDQ